MENEQNNENPPMSVDPHFAPPPVAPFNKIVTFGEAMIELVHGKKIRRLEWPIMDYGFIKDGFVAIHKNGEDFAHWNISDGDILAGDWIVKTEN